MSFLKRKKTNFSKAKIKKNKVKKTEKVLEKELKVIREEKKRNKLKPIKKKKLVNFKIWFKFIFFLSFEKNSILSNSLFKLILSPFDLSTIKLIFSREIFIFFSLKKFCAICPNVCASSS